jgi:hypothetical protein
MSRKERKKSRGDLILQPAAEGPRPGRVHVDRVDVRHEHLEGAPQRDVQSPRIPGVVGILIGWKSVFFTRRNAPPRSPAFD